MSEIHPQITYDDEGVFGFRRTEYAEPEKTSRQEAVLEEFDKKYDIEISKTDAGDWITLSLKDELEPYFGFLNAEHQAIEGFIGDVRQITGLFNERDGTDRVLGFELWDKHGARVAVYDQFQRFINSNVSRSEETFRSVLEAMAMPFGQEIAKKYLDEFEYRGDYEASAGLAFYIKAFNDRFEYTEFQQTQDEQIERTGRVKWNWVNIATLGNCACMGVDAGGRGDLYRDENNPSRLYNIEPHNVDFSRQSLSLVLGHARLADEATKYPGREDNFSDTEWVEERHYPLI